MASFLDRPRGRRPVAQLTMPLYHGVIDDTVARVKPEFVQEGVDE